MILGGTKKWLTERWPQGTFQRQKYRVESLLLIKSQIKDSPVLSLFCTMGLRVSIRVGCEKAVKVHPHIRQTKCSTAPRRSTESLFNPGQPCRMMQRTTCYITLRMLLQQKCPLHPAHSVDTMLTTQWHSYVAANLKSHTQNTQSDTRDFINVHTYSRNARRSHDKNIPERAVPDSIHKAWRPP